MEWEVLIWNGPSIICEGRTTNLNNLIDNLQSKLKEYVEQYENRILTFHIQKIKGYKSASYGIVSHYIRMIAGPPTDHGIHGTGLHRHHTQLRVYWGRRVY